MDLRLLEAFAKGDVTRHGSPTILTSVIRDMQMSGVTGPSLASPTYLLMDRQLHEACIEGDLERLMFLIHNDPTILRSVTPAGNNCLHLAAILGYHEFAKEVWLEEPSLFLGTNKAGETPLVAALAADNEEMASGMIAAARQLLKPDMEGEEPLNEMLLKFDMRGNSVLHHAMRNGLEDLAVLFLDIEELLSKQVNKIGESPMHMAVRRGYTKVLERLLDIEDSSYSGPGGTTALHAAVVAGRTDLIEQLLKKLPKIADNTNDLSPLAVAILNANLECVKILLKHAPNLAYASDWQIQNSSFLVAACNGFVPIAEEIFRVCPDSAYANDEEGQNALHLAVLHEQTDFVDYILRTPKLHRLVNQPDFKGNLPLHIASENCISKILRLLLNYKRHDYTAPNINNNNALDVISVKGVTEAKTLKWNESYTLLATSIPSTLSRLVMERARTTVRNQAIKKVRSITDRYTTNTSLVAALLATVTFAAAFTLPGGYINDTSDAGQPIFARKAAFQVFLISDTIAMCSSLAVAFLCVLMTWEDMDFLLNYRKTTKALMWCAFVATVVAFGTGLFVVMAPKCMWLAILILVFSCIVPLLSKIVGEWPLLMLRLRVGRNYQKDLVLNI